MCNELQERQIWKERLKRVDEEIQKLVRERSNLIIKLTNKNEDLNGTLPQIL